MLLRHACARRHLSRINRNLLLRRLLVQRTRQKWRWTEIERERIGGGRRFLRLDPCRNRRGNGAGYRAIDFDGRLRWLRRCDCRCRRDLCRSVERRRILPVLTFVRLAQRFEILAEKLDELRVDQLCFR